MASRYAEKHGKSIKPQPAGDTGPSLVADTLRRQAREQENRLPAQAAVSFSSRLSEWLDKRRNSLEEARSRIMAKETEPIQIRIANEFLKGVSWLDQGKVYEQKKQEINARIQKELAPLLPGLEQEISQAQEKVYQKWIQDIKTEAADLAHVYESDYSGMLTCNLPVLVHILQSIDALAAPNSRTLSGINTGTNT
ncbi:MAG: hypothetical protein M3O22_08570, partial [Pseudomonadota bacterium]|nr:hypothetical protein [Pseudomonadota bacterium]